MIQTTENALIQKTKKNEYNEFRVKDEIDLVQDYLKRKDNRIKEYIIRSTKTLFCIVILFIDLSYFEFYIKEFQIYQKLSFNSLTIFELIFSILFFIFLTLRQFNFCNNKNNGKKSFLLYQFKLIILKVVISVPPFFIYSHIDKYNALYIDLFLFLLRFLYHTFNIFQNLFKILTCYIFQYEIIYQSQSKQTTKKSLLYLLQLHYFETVLILFSLALIIFTATIRQIEIMNQFAFQLHDEYLQSELKNFINCFWYVFITMTTIGYGDMVVSCFYSRVLVGFISISGQIFISFFIVALSSFFQSDKSQEITVKLIEQIERKNQIQLQSCKSIQTILRIKNFDKQVKKKPKSMFFHFFTNSYYFYQNLRILLASRSKHQDQMYQQKKNIIKIKNDSNFVPAVLSRQFYYQQQQQKQVKVILRDKLKKYLKMRKTTLQQYCDMKQAEFLDELQQELKKIENLMLKFKKNIQLKFQMQIIFSLIKMISQA